MDLFNLSWGPTPNACAFAVAGDSAVIAAAICSVRLCVYFWAIAKS